MRLSHGSIGGLEQSSLPLFCLALPTGIKPITEKVSIKYINFFFSLNVSLRVVHKFQQKQAFSSGILFIYLFHTADQELVQAGQVQAVG